MDKRISDLNTLGTPDDADYLEVLDSSEILPNNINKKMTLLTLKNWITNAFTLPNHKNTHVVGGTDAFLITDLLDAIARIRVKIGNVLTGTRRGINFIPGTNVTITTLDDGANDQVNVTINATNNGGDVTNGANLGGQNEVFVNKTAGILNYRTIEGTGATSVSTVGNVIQINTPASTGEANTMANVGTGLGTVFRDKVGVNFNVKTINAGTNIQVVNNPNDITISTTAQNNQGVNIGGSVEVYAGMSGANLQFRTFQGTGSVTVNQSGNNIVINSNVLSPNNVNVGTGQGVFKNTTGNNYNFKSVLAGTGCSVTSTTDEIVINVTKDDRLFGNIIYQDIDGYIKARNNDFGVLLSGGIYTLINNISITSSFVVSNNLSIEGSGNQFTNSVLSNNSIIDIQNLAIRVYINNINLFSSILNSTLINLQGGAFIIKNTVFNTINNTTAPALIISGSGNVYIEDCVFTSQLVLPSTLTSYIHFNNFTGTCIVKNSLFRNNAVTNCMTSNTTINVRLLGKNYASTVQDANITFITETLTIDPTL